MDNSYNFSNPIDTLKNQYLTPLNITNSELASALNIDKSSVSRLLNKKITISPDMAIRLEICFGRSASSWLTQQNLYLLALLKKSNNKKYKKVKPLYLSKIK